MTATLADERTGDTQALGTANLYIGTWPIAIQGCGILCGPAHVGIGGEHYRYEAASTIAMSNIKLTRSGACGK